MSSTRRSSRGPALMWFALLGAPAAWTLQHVTGYALTEAACGRAGSGWDVPVDGATAAVTAAAAAVAVLAGLSALRLWRDTRPAEGVGGAEEAPPRGRVHFLATVGMAIAPLFLAIILMSGLAAIVLANCQQS
jgi:hypothetical protein